MEGLRHFSHAHANHICNSFRSAIFTQLQEHTGLGLVDMQLEHAEHDPLASPPPSSCDQKEPILAGGG